MKFNMNDYTNGEAMKMIREWTGLTQSQFGASIGKSRETIKLYENGKVNYSVKTLRHIAEKHNLKITIEKDN